MKKDYWKIDKHNHTKEQSDFILGNPHGEENPTKIPLYRCIKSTKIKPQTNALPPCRYVSLSLPYALYTSECVCSNEEHTSSTLLFFTLHFFPNKSAPTNLLGQLHPRSHKQYYIIFKRVLFTRLTMEVLPNDFMMTKYNSNIPMEE